MASVSTSPLTRYDVFLSFRGIDTRYKFTDHLYNSLHRSRIRTFMDDPELRNGEVISDSLLQAIRDSKTYVVVFSKNYASSPWCLDELAEILGCYERNKRSVITVFYKIDPSVVRHQTGSFREAFEKHQTRFDTGRVDKWRAVLTKVADLKGYHVLRNMSQANIINEVVDRVSLEINPLTLDVAKYPVGLDSRVRDVATLLSSDTEDVTKIGLHGMGGVGKTTLAKALYNLRYHSFQGSCFLANVREVSGTRKGMVYLQQQLINDVLKCKDIIIDNADHGIELIRARICSTKVLIVIDDLDNPEALEFIEGPFAFGSKIIITTRNEDLLDSIKVQARYKVNELDDAESRQLFCQHAFGDDKISDTFTELSKVILDHAGGLPLALKVFGSNLLSQSEEGWRWFIEKLKRVSIDDVENKLVISFDALKLVDPMLQHFFLDIACFFIGRKKEEIVTILETTYTFVNRNIEILKKRGLLTVSNRDELGMHDLLRDMGREIARNNSPDEPGKHSRLWVSKDISHVLRKHKGTEVIEGIIPVNFYDQDAPMFSYHDALVGVSYDTETFKRMSKLRFLYLKKANLTGSFEHIFEDLRLLCWESCPLKCLPSEFYPQKLVILELPHSKMRTMWKLNAVPRVFEMLKTLNMKYSLDLTTTPDFTKLPCLETLNFEGCKSLEKVHVSIGSLVRLLSLNLEYCSNLGSLPDSICNLKELKVLNISNCSSLEALPVELGNLESLVQLNAKGLTVLKLPDSVGCLEKLVVLILSHNENLETLPNTICKLRVLEHLSVDSCSSLETLPLELGNLGSLKVLAAEGLNVSKLPDSIGRLSNLVELRLSYNKNLETLPDTLCNLRALQVLCINNCSSLKALPVELGTIESLTELKAWGLSISRLPDSIGHLSKLVELILGNNTILKTLPDTICNLRALKFLDIGGCSSLEVLPKEIGFIESLTELNAWGLTVSKLPDSIGQLTKLSELTLSDNENLETLPGTIYNLRSLEILNLWSCNKLGDLTDQLWKITSLRKLSASGSTLLRKAPDIESSQQIALSLIV